MTDRPMKLQENTIQESSLSNGGGGGGGGGVRGAPSLENWWLQSMICSTGYVISYKIALELNQQ